MTRLAFLLLFSLFFAEQGLTQQSGDISYNPNLTKDSSRRSIQSRAVGVIGGDTITIHYYSPGVRGRVIWGGLVPYGEVWVTGAHAATHIDFPSGVLAGGTRIPAGRYGFFTIPGEEEWTLILNKNWDQHLADDYDAKDDVVRIKVKPVQVPHTERLQYFVEAGMGKQGTIAVAWEKLRLAMDVTILP